MDYRTSRRTRLEAPPVSPETVLITLTVHACIGESAAVIAPAAPNGTTGKGDQWTAGLFAIRATA